MNRSGRTQTRGDDGRDRSRLGFAWSSMSRENQRHQRSIPLLTSFFKQGRETFNSLSPLLVAITGYAPII